MADLVGQVSVSVDLAALDAYLSGTEARIAAVVATFAELIAKRARELCPVKTGALAESIHAEIAGWAAEIIAGEGLPDARAVYVEMGTLRAGAQPFLRPAVEQYADAFALAIQAAVAGG